MDEYVVIPRNIRVKEIMAYGLSGKQVLYLGIGVGASIVIWSITGVPLDVKMALSVLSISTSLFLSLAKIHGQDLDRYVVNSIKYPLRQKQFGGDSIEEKRMVIRIRYNI
jgi:hypothetical protein